MSLSVPPFRITSVSLINPTGGPILPLPPPLSSPEEDDSSDDESDSGGDNDHHDDEHHSTKPIKTTSSSLSSAQQPTTLFTSSSIPFSTSIGTTFLTTKSFSSLDASSTSSITAPARAAQTSDPATIDSIPQNEANPVIESRVTATPLGIAGTVLVAIFGFVALMTTFYFFFRMTRRRRTGNGNGVQQGLQRSHDNGTLEKNLGWASTTQETGIIFSHRSPVNELSPPGSQGRGRFSFLNRRWYSTGSEATAAQAHRSPPPSPPRWGTGLFGLGLRSRAETPHSHSVSMSTLETSYRSQTQNPSDIATPDLQRNFSQRSGGDGHARAYAHHNVKAPRSVRNTMTSISSRLIRRRDREQKSPALLPTRSPTETSEMYDGSRRTTIDSERLVRLGRESSATVPPRIPLPVAVGEGRRMSNRSV